MLGLGGGCGRVRTAPGEVVVLLESPLRDLDPRFAVSSYDTKVSRLVAAGLTTVDAPDSRPRMLLAESIEREASGVYRVRLRADARFSYGSRVTAEDVAYTYGSLTDPALHSPWRKAMEERGILPSAMEILDDRTVRFRLPRPLATFVTDLELGLVSKRAALAAGGRFPAGSVVGAGPFRLMRNGAERAELAPNPYWIGGAPSIARLVFKVVRDDGARILSLVGGSADLLQNTAAPSPLLVDTVLENRALKATFARSATWSYLGVNCEDSWLRDPRVRRALALAIDRPSIVATKLNGRGVVSSSMLPPSNWAHDPTITAWPYDPAAARALLAAAGAQGRQLTLKTSANSKFRVALARVIASQLAEVGLEVEVRAYEFGTFLGDIKRGNFDLFLLQMAEVTEPDFFLPLFHSSRIPTYDDPDVGLNRWRYRDAELDHWLEAGRAAEDPQARRAIYARVEARLRDALPAIPLWHEDNVAVMRRELSGYAIFPNARFSALAEVRKLRP
jgi:peptide/nickel transport system substrate-binding protein